jgi:cytochrome P450
MDPPRASRSAPPGPTEQFDIGSTADSLQKMQQYFAEFGDVYRVYAPGRRRDTWVISDPDDVKRVLLSNHRNYTKGVGMDRVKILLGNGIIVSEGDFWRRQRRMIQPAFHRRVIERFGNLIAQGNQRLLARWQIQSAQQQPINITTEMSELTLEIVLGSIFGRDLALMSDAAGDNPFAVVSRDPARNLPFAFRFRSLTKYVVEAIRRRRAHPEEDNFDFLGMLMSATGDDGVSMSESELVDEIMTLIVAGHETTASVLNWAWYLLATHPQAQARLQAELADAPLADHSLKSIEALTYTHQIVREALRLYPPVWVMTRRAIAADSLAGYDLPAGTDVFLSPYMIHRHPAHWEDPESFRPERFTAQAEQARHRYAYFPFSAGPHHCVGETFAIYEMVMHLAMAARRFRLQLPAADAAREAVEIEALINLRTGRDLYMNLTRR